MKTNIQTRKSEKTGGIWTTWTEICDCCGKQYRTSGNWDTSEKLIIEKEDLCLDCLYFALDNQITGPGRAEKIKAAMAAEKAKNIANRTGVKP